MNTHFSGGSRPWAKGGGGGGGLDLLALSAIFPKVISSFFTQNKGEGGAGPPLDPPLHFLLTVHIIYTGY